MGFRVNRRISLGKNVRGNNCMLVTAYYVDHDHSFNKLLKEYDQSSLNGNCVQ